MIPKLGLTAENIKSFEEAKSDDAGIWNKVDLITWIEIKWFDIILPKIKAE